MSIWLKKVRLSYYKTMIYVFGTTFILLSACKSKNPTTTDTPQINPIDSGITKSDSTKTTNGTLVAPSKKVKKDSIIKPKTIRVINDVKAEYGVEPYYYEKMEKNTNE